MEDYVTGWIPRVITRVVASVSRAGQGGKQIVKGEEGSSQEHREPPVCREAKGRGDDPLHFCRFRSFNGIGASRNLFGIAGPLVFPGALRAYFSPVFADSARHVVARGRNRRIVRRMATGPRKTFVLHGGPTLNANKRGFSSGIRWNYPRATGYFVFLDFLIRRNIRALSAKLILTFDRTYLFILVTNICIW